MMPDFIVIYRSRGQGEQPWLVQGAMDENDAIARWVAYNLQHGYATRSDALSAVVRIIRDTPDDEDEA